MPSDSGVTSSSSTSLTSPARTPPWIAAPIATTSSGLTPLWGSLPKKSLTTFWIAGMRVWPPTSTTSSMSLDSTPESFNACLLGAIERWTRSSTSCSSFGRVSRMFMCFGPDASAVMNGRLMSVSWALEQLDLGLLGGLLQALDRHRVAAEVDPLVLLELLQQPVDDPLVDVVAAQVGVAVGRLDLDHPLADLEDRDVEGAAAEVVDGDRLVLLLVQAVGERRRGRLVDQPLDGQAGDAAGVLGGLPLGVVEVGRHGDHRAVHLLAEVVLGRLLQLAEDHRRDLGGRVLLPLDDDAHVAVVGPLDLIGHHLHLFRHLVVLAPHEALDREDGVLGVGDRLPLGNLPDETLTALGKGHDRGGGAVALGVGDHLRLAAFHDGDDAVGRPQVDSDDFAHLALLLRYLFFRRERDSLEPAPGIFHSLEP